MAGRLEMTKNRKHKILYKIKLSLNSNWEDLLKLSEEQVDYINLYLNHSSYLEACPGSGKTEVIGLKSAFEISKWKSFNSGIAVVTFTTSAAKELNQRVRKFGAVSTETFPHFIGTFDSWIHNYLLQPFTHYLTKYAGRSGDKSINIVDVESSAGFLYNYDTKIYKDGKPIQIKVTDYYYDYNGILQVNDDKKEALIKTGRTAAEIASFLEKKKEFIKAGFATYSDVEWLCKHLLKKFPFYKIN
ncbi:MAG: ATP-dependent helicase [Chitinophagaceae bacterium]|nr:ATP-dependent helicase [Chitinophagaceae bacterium]